MNTKVARKEERVKSQTMSAYQKEDIISLYI